MSLLGGGPVKLACFCARLVSMCLCVGVYDGPCDYSNMLML